MTGGQIFELIVDFDINRGSHYIVSEDLSMKNILLNVVDLVSI